MISQLDNPRVMTPWFFSRQYEALTWGVKRNQNKVVPLSCYSVLQLLCWNATIKLFFFIQGSIWGFCLIYFIPRWCWWRYCGVDGLHLFCWRRTFLVAQQGVKVQSVRLFHGKQETTEGAQIPVAPLREAPEDALHPTPCHSQNSTKDEAKGSCCSSSCHGLGRAQE